MKKISSYIILSFLFFILISPLASAQLLNQGTSVDLNSLTEQTTNAAGLAKPELGIMAATIIQVILSFLSIIFLGLIIFAGFKWMTAAGNEEDIKKSQGTIKNALIGLIIILAAYAITYYIFNVLPFNSGTPQAV